MKIKKKPLSLRQKLKTMPEHVRARVLEIRVKSKTGRGMTAEEQRIIEWAWKKWPQDYSAIESEVLARAMESVNPLYRRGS